jgi:hypothetical protein
MADREDALPVDTNDKLFGAYFASFRFVFRGLLGYVAYIWIFPPWFSAWLHKARGVNIREFKTVYIAPNVLLDTNFPERLTIGNHVWPAPGSEDTKLGVLMEREVRHGEAEVYAGV